MTHTRPGGTRRTSRRFQPNTTHARVPAWPQSVTWKGMDEPSPQNSLIPPQIVPHWEERSNLKSHHLFEGVVCIMAQAGSQGVDQSAGLEQCRLLAYQRGAQDPAGRLHALTTRTVHHRPSLFQTCAVQSELIRTVAPKVRTAERGSTRPGSAMLRAEAHTERSEGAREHEFKRKGMHRTTARLRADSVGDVPLPKSSFSAPVLA